MNSPQPGLFWVLLVLGTPQAALAASILYDSAATWWLTAGAYPVWLLGVARHYAGRTGRVFLAGYVAPMLVFAAVYARAAMPGRPETPRALALVRTERPERVATRSDVPAPKLAPAAGDRGLTRGVLMLASTFVYVAACAVAGLLWGTPVPVYVAAGVVGVLVLRRNGVES